MNQLHFPLCLSVIYCFPLTCKNIHEMLHECSSRVECDSSGLLSNQMTSAWRAARFIYLASWKNSCKQAASDRCFHRFLRHASVREILIFTARIDKLFLSLFRFLSRVKRGYNAPRSYNIVHRLNATDGRMDGQNGENHRWTVSVPFTSRGKIRFRREREEG